MGLRSPVGSCLFFLGLCGICAGFVQENCTNYKLQFERVFSVPGDVAMLNSTLVSPEVFNFTTVPYNITWYNSKTREEMNNTIGQILVYGETLWFLNVTLDDDGEYVAVVRTPSKCYMQATKLVVDLPVPGECGRPRRAFQPLTNGASDTLHCPLKDYIDKLDSYNMTSSVQWYRGCDPIVDGIDEYSYWDVNKLSIAEVGPQHNCLYTCTLTFTLGGVLGSVSETISAEVKDFHLAPQVHEPANEIIKALKGSKFSKRCLVFVPGVETPFIDVFWFARGDFIFTTNPSDRVYTSEARMWSQHDHIKGTWIERMLMISELKKEDFNISYTCQVHSSRGIPMGHFTLLQAAPNILLPIGLVLGGATILFIISVIVCYIFKIDIVLWFRKAFPVLYKNKDLDGKLYDAYVAYPQPYDFGFSNEVETFALHTLPQVLEKACDYKLFIAGRDCLPGQATVDSAEENIQASRRLLLLYTASTFIRKRHTCSTSSNNNNISKSSDISDKGEIKTSETSDSMTCDCSDKSYPDTMQQFECVAAMYRALLEGSLKVVLVELEEITPAQLALFPESVRHLRKKQGAVCWWKNLKTRQRRRTCMSRKEDEENGGEDSQWSPSLSPSSTFWKEMRYHMPVRGKRVVYPEKTALLSL
ncbi:interleukin-1 receptor type 1-like isoform X7 [Acanthochromis polyacanthus]|uniref:interleukin-1 receptor type 1-like isoform X5 n=1 Tax=Acanthochromis polyacanthus TaxID=80966 RepID=UPI002234D9C4|nr:interleukin-1 receptor type 1-like isoform X5 [Acanthochromis polyacanthus]XP_051814871.1 interleukin-1 receptor type 1-like isoform X7 [Acanthochromis polyacanthus]XP_051814872.1 interleukin-1 receptor type 1-like isoform X5 [Acanthochromis polyacanthus]XP_051814873.1 interleukin-1 receptor type 1-like isoform X5 [Acanthochromis polyacanthus]XP_051814874.1 interleukin-1 receptor type 1-like isoform X5 [Acanthochromis polyacanthus]XP_051814875.1 interleukin-1 receptor type 1-like isoform X7